MIPVSALKQAPHSPRTEPEPIMVARRSRRIFEVLTGHQRLAVAQELGLTTPAVVMDTGETVWISPSGTVFQHDRTDLPSRREAPSR